MDPFDLDAELAVIRERMMQPVSRERQVAAELWGYPTTVGSANRSRFAASAIAADMIKTLKHTRDLSTEDVATAMNSLPRAPLPTRTRRLTADRPPAPDRQPLLIATATIQTG